MNLPPYMCPRSSGPAKFVLLELCLAPFENGPDHSGTEEDGEFTNGRPFDVLGLEDR